MKWVIVQIATTTRLGWAEAKNLELAQVSQVKAQLLGPFFGSFPSSLAGSWTRCSHVKCWHCRHWFNVLCHNGSPHIYGSNRKQFLRSTQPRLPVPALILSKGVLDWLFILSNPIPTSENQYKNTYKVIS